MNQEERSRKEQEQAEERVRILQAQLNEAKKGEKIAIRKHENHHKYMMGGVVHKYFPECYGFDEEEMNDIIGCAFRQANTQALIKRLLDKKNTENEEGTGKVISTSGGTASITPTTNRLNTATKVTSFDFAYINSPRLYLELYEKLKSMHDYSTEQFEPQP